MISGMDACPCGSRKALEQCCQPIIDGTDAPITAEALMRARYSAYVLGEIDFIIESNHPDTRDEALREDIEQWSKGSEWMGLYILEVEGGEQGEDEGTIRFRARYGMDGKVHVHNERARFRRDAGGAWKFHTAEDGTDSEPELVPVTPRSEQVGRNEPCPCGSGRKFKRCCA